MLGGGLGDGGANARVAPAALAHGFAKVVPSGCREAMGFAYPDTVGIATVP